MDFDWPLHKRWNGFINPHYHRCPADGTTCFGGQTGAAQWLDSFARLLMMAGEDSQFTDDPQAQARFAGAKMVWPHPYLQEMPNRPTHSQKLERWSSEAVLAPKRPDYIDGHISSDGKLFATFRTPISTDMQELTTGLSGRKPGIRGLGSGAGAVVRKIRDAAGVRADWGNCPVCKGTGMDPASEDACRAWRKTEPPTGDGFQLWETCTSGSPASPVFASLDDLCEWCVDGATTFGSAHATADEWREMLDGGVVHHEEDGIVFL